jgi:signal transduction histidine kinase
MLTTFLRWFQAPTFSEDEDKTRSALLLNVVLNTFLFALPALLIGSFLGGRFPRIERIQFTLICAWLTIFGTRLIMRAGRVATAGVLTVVMLFITTTLSIYNLGTIRAPATSFYILTIVMAGLTISRRAILWTAGVSTLTIITLMLGEMRGFLPLPTLTISITQGITFTVAFAIVAILLFLAVKSIDEALAHARREIAERKRVEEEREKFIEELGKQNAELERFTYTVSHDLRNPLVTIKGFLGMLDKDLKENRLDRIQNDFQRIAGATDKMDALLSDLLELSRIGRVINPPEETDLSKLIRESLESLDARIHSKNVAVIISPDLPTIYCDCLRLREVFENLIDNAAKYMGNQPEPTIEIGVRDTGNEPVIFVKDNGIGIEERYQSRIFTLFEKLNPTVEGTGVGLTLVKRIIETQGGKIWVESEGLGKGTTFCFTIPDTKVGADGQVKPPLA